MLAGNKLTSLPTSMKNCQDLELIRLAANNFSEFPDWYVHFFINIFLSNHYFIGYMNCQIYRG